MSGPPACQLIWLNQVKSATSPDTTIKSKFTLKKLRKTRALEANFIPASQVRVQEMMDHWARGQLEAFKEQFGYDPLPWLQALVVPGADQMPFHALNVQLVCDHDLVITNMVCSYPGSTHDKFIWSNSSPGKR